MSRVNSLSLPDRGPGSPREKLIPYPGGLKANHIFAGPGARPEPYELGIPMWLGSVRSFCADGNANVQYSRNEPLGHKSQE